MSGDYKKYIGSLVKRAKAAQEIANSYSQERVDELCAAIAYACIQPDFVEKVAVMLKNESGMGTVEAKMAKIENKTRGVYRDMKGGKSVGLLECDEKSGVSIYAKPMGIIGALIPVTAGEGAPVFKSMSAIKGRNAIILAPHPKGANTNKFITDKIRDTLKKLDAPEDLVISIDVDYVSIECSGELMKQVDMVWATGGTPMVKAAYSSGTPTIGVGTGNVASLIDGTTDLNSVANMIVSSKTFDGGTSCSTENNIVVFEECYDKFIKAMEKQNVYLIKENTPEKEALKKLMWPNTPHDHELNRKIVAQPALKIAEMAGIMVPSNTVMLIVEENGGFGNEYPFNGEKLSPISSVRKCKDFEDGVQKMEKILNYQGLGHSSGIHSNIPERIHALGERIKTVRVCVNQPQALANSGTWTNSMPMTFTVGVGTWGHTSISKNVNWKDFLNFTYVYRPIPSTKPTDEELFDEKTRKAFAD
ncbi:MAG: aldehyde dehydrogenase family protein [Clostridia bacterium]|jgi:sulfoacetaldehyde dehydrogenase|nr:aldehyde dehydrogenase family protein [Clostridia bacterium]